MYIEPFEENDSPEKIKEGVIILQHICTTAECLQLEIDLIKIEDKARKDIPVITVTYSYVDISLVIHIHKYSSFLWLGESNRGS